MRRVLRSLLLDVRWAWGFFRGRPVTAWDEPVPTVEPAADDLRDARLHAVRDASDRFIDYAISRLEKQFDTSEEAGS